jgi:hypothetical protein
MSIIGAIGLMQSRPGLARLADADVELIMGRERQGVFDDARHPRGDGKPHVRDDLIPGDEVDWEAFGRRVMGVLEELTPQGKAIVQAMLFDRLVRTEVDANVLRMIVVLGLTRGHKMRYGLVPAGYLGELQAGGSLPMAWCDGFPSLGRTEIFQAFSLTS